MFDSGTVGLGGPVIEEVGIEAHLAHVHLDGWLSALVDSILWLVVVDGLGGTGEEGKETFILPHFAQLHPRGCAIELDATDDALLTAGFVIAFLNTALDIIFLVIGKLGQSESQAYMLT